MTPPTTCRPGVSPRPGRTARIAGVALGAAVILAAAGCSTASSGQQAQPSYDPRAVITDLPHDAEEINRIMYGRLVEQWRPVLAAFGEHPVTANFSMGSSGTGIPGTEATITINLGQRPQSEWQPLEQKMIDVAKAQGWSPIVGGIEGLNSVKNGYYLRGGCASIDGCIWEIDSSSVPEEGIESLNWQGKVVPELLGPNAPSTPTSTTP